MMVWPVFGFMTLVAIFAVLWPLIRKPRFNEARGDLAVYGDQLMEIDRDLVLGLIPATEAQSARTEVSRRMLGAAETKSAPATSMPWLRRALVIATLIALPGGAVSVYLSLGSPNLAGQAIAGPLKDPHQGQSVPELVGRVEAYLARNPEDGRAWEVLAPVYLRLGRFDDAVVARRKALAYNGETAERQADLGEAIAAAAKWTVTAEAKAAFERARVLDSSEIKTRYFFGLAAEQEGRPQDAAAIWRAMLAEAPAQANWIGTVRTALGRVDGTASKSTSAPSTATPAPSSAADTAAASGASSSASPHGDAASANDAASGHASSAASATDPAQHDDKIRGMVSRLADRLKSKGGELDEWVQLVRSYLVLGDKDKAREAANDGESAMASDPEKLGRLRTVLKELGLER